MRKNASSRTSDSSTISSAYVSQLLERFKNQRVKEPTALNYHGIWKNFNKFLIRLDTRPDTWEEKVAWYAGYLIDSGFQSSTLKSYITAIKKTLESDGYEWQQDKLKLTLITGICRNLNDTVKIRLPIGNGLLELFLFEIERKFTENNQYYLEIMYKAFFLLLYYGLFRVGELATGRHPVQARDVHQSTNRKKLLFLLRSSKTHGRESRPQKVEIEGDPNLFACKNYYCPYLNTRDYLNARGCYIELTEPLFVFSDGSPVKPTNVRKLMKEIISAINLDPRFYNTHSFRIGRATDLYKAGYAVDVIKTLGRWKSNAIYKYLKL